MFFDPLYLIIVMPFVLLSLYASIKVQTTFKKYLQVPARSGLTGSQAARELLNGGGLQDVAVEEGGGFLSDFYDPLRKRLSLSPEVYEGNSLASVGVAAHETGHAFQHSQGYLPLQLRSSLVPVAGFGSNAGWIMAVIGIAFQSGFMLNLGILLFSCAVLFYVITLPVEFNASSRAVALLTEKGIVGRDEEKAVRDVLGAAALTYLAAALTAVAQLLYLLALRNRD
ncbi:MAG: zinc metallopeptidase [Candidatus Eremiobacteraeota bacterium]|nr:zinc metallopeptidase [Candidatus Eremiobacteraeota bacterium]